MSSQKWGEADSIPPNVQNGLCGVATVPRLQRRDNPSLVKVSNSSLTDTSNGNVTSAALTPADVNGLPESALKELAAMGLTPPAINGTSSSRAGRQLVRWSA